MSGLFVYLAVPTSARHRLAESDTKLEPLSRIGNTGLKSLMELFCWTKDPLALLAFLEKMARKMPLH